MTRFADDIEKFAPEPILWVVIGRCRGTKIPKRKSMPKYKVLDWSEGRKWLDFETEYGYGAPKQPAIYVYTEHYVIGIDQYDGATSLFAVPRYPVNCKPQMLGGGG